MTLTFPLIDAFTGQPVPKGGVLALGNFDGVHLGHRDVVRAAAKKAKEIGSPAYAMTFLPHPYAFFHKEKKPFRLTHPRAKVRLLREAGADNVIALSFEADMAALSAEDFISRILLEGLAVRHVAVGFNFVFGAGRKGDRDALRARLEPLGIGVTEVPPHRNSKGEIISSSRIRTALETGDLIMANEMLGRPFLIEGTVIKGDQRGRLLGMPTANMDLGNYVRPRRGVYAVTAKMAETSDMYQGVANIGVRPTIGGKQELIETNLFGFDREIYGEDWDIALHAFIRPEKRFADLVSLKAQMQIDKESAKQALKG